MTSEVDIPNRILRNNLNTQNVEGDARISIVDGGYQPISGSKIVASDNERYRKYNPELYPFARQS